MSEPDEYSAANRPAGERESHPTSPYEFVPAELEWKEVGVTVVKKESNPSPVIPGFHTFPGEESSGGEGPAGHPDFGSPPTPPDPPPVLADTFPEEFPETRPRCTGSDCFVAVPCRPGFSTTTRIAPQPLLNPTNLGNSPLKVSFVGPRVPPNGGRPVIGEADIAPGATGSNLVPPPGTDSIYISCTGSGAVSFRFSIGVS